MSEENNNTEMGENNLGGDANQPTYVTKDDLEGTLKGFQDSMFSMLRKMNSEKQQAPAPTPEPSKKSANTPEPSQEVVQLRRELAIEKALGRLGLNESQESALKTLAMAENPDDLESWAKDRAGLFGKAEASPESQTMPENNIPAPNAPAPAAHQPKSSGDDVTKWSSEEYDRQFQLNAKVPANKYDIRNREFYKQIRQRAEAQMARTSVYIGPDKG